jgi:N-acetylglutamate synthase-like GNAT family acetyltransferase
LAPLSIHNCIENPRGRDAGGSRRRRTGPLRGADAPRRPCRPSPRAPLIRDVPLIPGRRRPDPQAGVESDANTIRFAILKEKMNPLGLDPRRFVVAEEGGQLVGFGQLKPWETLSRRRKGDLVGNVVRFLNLEPNWRGQLLELASLVVMPEHRGRGVGTALLNRLIEDSIDAKDPETLLKQETTLCLLTLKSTVGFYEKAGFSVISSEQYVPRPLQAELAAGKVVAAVVADDECVAMKLESLDIEEAMS